MASSRPSRFIVAVLLLIVASATQSTLAFISPPTPQCIAGSSSSPSKCQTFPTQLVHNNQKSPQTTSSLSASSTNNNNNVVEITFPTPDEAASMGIRDWPQQFHNKEWTEMISEGQIATRYVLSGKGRVTIDYYDNENVNIRQRTNQRVYPGTLIEVDGEANLFWEVDDMKEGMIVLTPSFFIRSRFSSSTHSTMTRYARPRSCIR